MAKARDKIMIKLQINYLLILIGILFLSTTNVNSQQLYVGANYHPHDDKNREKIKKDIELMKDAGFTVVRMGKV